MRPRVLASIACALAAVATTAAARVVSVPINHTMRLAVAGPVASVVVGNPAVADVSVVDSRTVFVAGRGYGSTDVTVLDALGRTLYSSDIEVTAPAHGSVAVYRGGARSDLSCDPSCGVAVTTAGAAPLAGGSNGVAAANTAAALPGAIPSAVSGAAASVGSPLSIAGGGPR